MAIMPAHTWGRRAGGLSPSSEVAAIAVQSALQWLHRLKHRSSRGASPPDRAPLRRRTTAHVTSQPPFHSSAEKGLAGSQAFILRSHEYLTSCFLPPAAKSPRANAPRSFQRESQAPVMFCQTFVSTLFSYTPPIGHLSSNTCHKCTPLLPQPRSSPSSQSSGRASSAESPRSGLPPYSRLLGSRVCPACGRSLSVRAARNVDVAQGGVILVA